MIYCTIPVWLRISLLWLTLLLMGGDAFAQTPYKVDSASNAWSKLVGTLGATISAPCQIRVLTGDGAKFARIGVPLLIKISPWTRASGYQDTTHYELDSVSAISGDTLTISKRKLSNSYQLGWAAGSRVEVAFDFPLVKVLTDKINAAAVLPTQSGQSGKVLGTNGTSTSWVAQSAGGVSSFNTRTGAVVPASGDYSFTQVSGTLGVARGGTGLTSIASGQMLYASTTNTLAQLNPNTGLSISGGNLNVSLASFTTDNLSQGSTNIYYKDSLARLSISATAPVLYSSTTGVISETKASSSSDGWLSSSDFASFNNKQSALTLPLSIANGGTGQITRAAALKALLPDTASKTGYFLKVDSTGDILWRPISIGTAGSGTVTSVALSVPAWLSISGSPITTSGTLAIASANEDSGKVLAGPVSGSAATPAFRLLAATDIPNLSAAQITSGVLPVANGGTGQSSWTNGQLAIGNNSGNTLTKTTLTGTSNEIIVTNGAGSITLSTPQAIGTGSSPTFSALTLTNPLTVANGGTGQSTLTANTLLLGNGTSAVTLLAPGGTNTVLTGSSTPSFQTLAVDATLVGNGIGTSFGLDLTHANTWTGTPTVSKANILTTYTDGLTLTNPTAADVSNTVQQSPSISLTSQVWNTTATATDSIETWRITNVSTSGANTTSSLMLDNGNTGAGFTNVASLSDAGVWNLKTGGSYQINGTSVLNATTLGSGVVNSSLTSVGTIATGVWNGTTIAVNKGGTGATTLTGVLFGNGTSAITGSHSVSLTSEVTGTLPVANGGTSLATLTAHSLYVGNGTSAPTALGSATNGQIAIGSTGADPVLAALTGTANNVTVTNSAGGITLSLPNTITLANSAVGILQIAATASTDGKQLSIASGAAGAGSNLSGGPLLLKVGNATGTGGGTIYFSWPVIGMTGSGAANAAIMGQMYSVASGTDNYATLELGANTGLKPGQLILRTDTGTSYIIRTDGGLNGGGSNITIRRPGAAADFLLETSSLSGTGSLIVNTTTRGVLSQVAIGTTGQVLMVTAGVPTWTDVFKNTGGAAKCGQAALVSGTATVTTTSAITTSLIYITDVTGSGIVANIGKLRVDSISNGVSFTVVSDNVLDASSFNWLIINP